MAEKDIMQEMFNKWTGKKDMPNEQLPVAKDGGMAESTEPYVDISPVSAMVQLPFEAKEGDMLDINAVVKKINEDGTAEIEINKAFKK